MGVGGSLAAYQIIESTRKTKLEKSRHVPSVFLVFLICSPFIIATLMVFEGMVTFGAEPFSIFLLWAMMFTFWSTFLFVPIAIANKYGEEILPNLNSYPKVSIIIPAYNEEKVIVETIEALIESKYPKKEILLVDDGSTDNTLIIAMQYRDKIKIFHKENGGKASALNYGLNYSTGEIIVVVDADTIVGRHAINEIVKELDADHEIAAIAGNCKVRNRTNWITKCQALEYIMGIQIVRRAFDTYGSVIIIPGALGAFKKKNLISSGPYSKVTLVEDFDQTLKILKAGKITQGSSKAMSYSEAPETLKDFIAQRKRWYRGNIQVVRRHLDTLTNPRFGNLHKLTFPYMLMGMILSPIIGFASVISAIIATIQGEGLLVLQYILIFTLLHVLTTAIAIRIDREDQKLLWYSVFLLFGYKQIMDALLLRALIEQFRNKKAVWTVSKRIGIK
jgi:cellulose synthase/poly-beta-1,6-N-acetylglucosamine synthase-like glycosyltransferase